MGFTASLSPYTGGAHRLPRGRDLDGAIRPGATVRTRGSADAGGNVIDLWPDGVWKIYDQLVGKIRYDAHRELEGCDGRRSTSTPMAFGSSMARTTSATRSARC